MFRWHDDLRLAPQLLVVARDVLEESPDAGQQLRAAGLAQLLPARIGEKFEEETCFLAAVAPLAGGLRLFRHTASAELSLEVEPAVAGAATTLSPAEGGWIRSDSEPSGWAVVGGAETPMEAGTPAASPEVEAAAAEPDADDLLAMGQGDLQQQQEDEETIAAKPCELTVWLNHSAEGHSLRPIVGMHVLPAGAGLGVVADAAAEGGGDIGGGAGVDELLMVRDDGTVQVLPLSG